MNDCKEKTIKHGKENITPLDFIAYDSGNDWAQTLPMRKRQLSHLKDQFEKQYNTLQVFGFESVMYDINFFKTSQPIEVFKERDIGPKVLRDKPIRQSHSSLAIYSWSKFPIFWRSHESWFFFRSLQDHWNESVFSSEWFTQSDKLNYMEKPWMKRFTKN